MTDHRGAYEDNLLRKAMTRQGRQRWGKKWSPLKHVAQGYTEKARKHDEAAKSEALKRSKK